MSGGGSWVMWQEQNGEEDNDSRQPTLAGPCRPE